jgi:hypothetical protein
MVSYRCTVQNKVTMAHLHNAEPLGFQYERTNFIFAQLAVLWGVQYPSNCVASSLQIQFTISHSPQNVSNLSFFVIISWKKFENFVKQTQI